MGWGVRRLSLQQNSQKGYDCLLLSAMCNNGIHTGDCTVDQSLCSKQFGNKKMSLRDTHVNNKDRGMYTWTWHCPISFWQSDCKIYASFAHLTPITCCTNTSLTTLLSC